MILLSKLILFVILSKLSSVPLSQFPVQYALEPIILSLKVTSTLCPSFLNSSLQPRLVCKHAPCDKQYFFVFFLGRGPVHIVFSCFVALFVRSSMISSYFSALRKTVRLLNGTYSKIKKINSPPTILQLHSF